MKKNRNCGNALIINEIVEKIKDKREKIKVIQQAIII